MRSDIVDYNSNRRLGFNDLLVAVKYPKEFTEQRVSVWKIGSDPRVFKWTAGNRLPIDCPIVLKLSDWRRKVMVARKVTRRAVLRHGMHFSLGGVTLLGLAACGDSDDQQVVCNKPGQLSNSEVSMRASLGYVDASPNSGEVCGGCLYFAAKGPGPGCGSCELLKGQISSEGRCNSWGARS